MLLAGDRRQTFSPHKNPDRNRIRLCSLFCRECIINSHTLSRLGGIGKQTKVNLDIRGLVNLLTVSVKATQPVI